MPVTIRIRNVQSIRDATLRVEGFTVVTGPNNSGKTASQRAVRGVFTNASPGPLVRHGESHLTVDLTFGDGHTVKWEKGEKVNRYTVDGKVLSTVGRGAPAEVTALGVHEIKAGSDRLWPQIAEQFGGTLFLVDRSGSVVAEALSDVDKVGRFTEALRLAESDRRSVGAELKVRRADLFAAEQELAGFDTLPGAVSQVERAEQALAEAESAGADLGILRALFNRKQAADVDIALLSSAPVDLVPKDASFAQDARTQAQDVARLVVEHARLSRETKRLAPIHSLVVPDPKPALDLAPELADLRAILGRLTAARAQRDRAQRHNEGAALVALTPSEVFARVSKAGGILADMANCVTRRGAARTELATATRDLEAAKKNLALLTEEVNTLLGDRGECPVCHTFCDTGAGGPHSPANG